ncbi:MAG: hypothetical protein AAGD86_00460 [Pseudomonadota bacterium]
MQTRVICLLSAVCALVALTARADIGGQHWFPLGPAPIEGFFGDGSAGRASAIAVNPFNVDELWIGGAAGGVWHSVNGGRNWRPIADDRSALAIGSLAVSGCTTSGCARLYAGTGENAIRRDTYYGRGLLVRETSGDQLVWTRRSGAPFNFDYGSLVEVVLDPTTSGKTQRLYVAFSSGNTSSASQATFTASPSTPYGLYRSDDDGVSWQALDVPGAAGAKPTVLRMHPTDSARLLAGFAGVGVFQTLDGGDTWCPLNAGVPRPNGCPVVTGLGPTSPAAFDHVDIAWHEAGPETIYVSFGHCPDQLLQQCVPSIYRSTNGGESWVLRSAGSSSGLGVACGSVYSRYTHVLAVHPEVSSTLFLGGLRLCRSTNGGLAFVESDNNLSPGGSPWGPITHLDHRELVFHPLDSDRVYSTNDGGFAYSTDGGRNWTPGNRDLQITGFYSLNASSITPRVLGGSQDNSGQLWLGFRGWEYTGSGDGAYALIDQVDPLRFYLGSNRGNLLRSTDGGLTFTSSIRPPTADSSNTAFNAPVVQDPVAPYALYYGSNRLHVSTSSGSSWSVVSPVLATGLAPEISPGINVITAIGARGDRVFVGYYGGQVFTSTAPCSNASCWTDVTGRWPAVPVTDIVIDPQNNDIAFLAFSGFDDSAHVQRTSNGGTSWTAAAQGLPVTVPVNALAIEADGTLWAGLDSGPAPQRANVYKSVDGGTSWAPNAASLPNAPVHDLTLDELRGRLYAGLHGRGAYGLGSATLGAYLGRVDGELEDLPLFGDGFSPSQRCELRLVQQDGTVCAASTTDARGGVIRTDSTGRLVSKRAGAPERPQVVWGCFAGQCLGNTPIEQCEGDGNGDGQADPLTTVLADCGGTPAVVTVPGGEPVGVAPGSLIDVGFFTVDERSGTVRRTDRQDRAAQAVELSVSATVIGASATKGATCETELRLDAGEAMSGLLRQAGAAFARNAACQKSGIGARAIEPPSGHGEDLWPRAPSMLVESPGTVAEQVVAGVTIAPGKAAPGTCVTLRGLGVPVHSRLRAMRTVFDTAPQGAEGGFVTYVEHTGQGRCAITVATEKGDSGVQVAGRVAKAMLGSAPTTHCPAESNARSTEYEANALVARFASTLTVCLQDDGVGVGVAPL